MPMKPDRIAIAAVLLLAAVALATRLIALDARPMHGDEANQAHKTGVLIEDGVYQYDPHEHHGPTLYYLAELSALLRGEHTFAETSESTYRIVPVLFSVMVIVLLLLVRDGLGNSGVMWASLFALVSPATVFYSRYFIQETLLVCFTFALIAFGWRFLRSGHWAWAVAAGVSLGLMHATKETSVIAWAAMGIAMAATFAMGRWRKGEGFPAARPRWNLALPLALLAAIGVSAMLYSSFFTYPRGILDSVLTYTSYLGRAAADEGQSGGAHWHEKPWHYYLSLLAYTKKPFGPVWTEGLILALAAVGGIAALIRRDATPLMRFMTFYTLVIIVAYSVIPYKTPWNALTMLHGCIVLAGLGAATLIQLGRILPVRIVITAALLAGVYQLSSQAYRANTEFNADPRNPYVYAHTSTSAVRLGERVQELAQVHPDGKDLLVRVVLPSGDYWPLPFYLRANKHVGYWSEIPEEVDAPIVITAPVFQGAIAERFRGDYELSHFSLRPGVILLMYVERDLWDRFMADRQ